MFHHLGKSRTPKHNLRLATFLSFVAGVVNITGFLGIRQLTTNLTGHYAHFINDVMRLDLRRAAIVLLYIICFLAGSFLSNTLIEIELRAKRLNKLVLPILLESLLLLSASSLIHCQLLHSPQIITCLLLTAMGVQNSFVTKVSNTVVRTTHLTGLFTDMGIELSQLCFQQTPEFRQKLRTTLFLRFSIVAFFFIGGAVASLLFKHFQFDTLLLAVGVLLTALLYDGSCFRHPQASEK